MASAPAALTLGDLTLRVPDGDLPEGTRVLKGLLTMASEALARLYQAGAAEGHGTRLMALGRVRGRGPAASFSELVATLESQHPLNLISPFEGSAKVGGAVWRAFDLYDLRSDLALAKLRWEAGARDLPMHSHDHTSRCIIVLQGRGFYHVTDEPVDAFTGRHVRTVAARERDVFLFTPGVVHTFSTTSHPMTLLSAQLPFIEFDDPRQYTLPGFRWTAERCLDSSNAEIGLDPAWSLLASGCRQKEAPVAGPALR